MASINSLDKYVAYKLAIKLMHLLIWNFEDVLRKKIMQTFDDILKILFEIFPNNLKINR